MRLHAILVAASVTCTAAQQSAPANAFGTNAPQPIILEENTSNHTTVITETLPLSTVVPEKPALEASIMGLVVFSAAGLVLL
ncbi:hypothetical protein GGR57DRAFT_502520 [Xylariaceae sp. FL1272]|nr:hypothetical protein GGR57DRAFT_502520 [Xylariaceae sp. FL1272]